MDSKQNAQLLLHQTGGGETQIQVIMQDVTFRLTQKDWAGLCQRDQAVMSRRVNNVFKEGKLDEESNMQKRHIANSDRPVAFYNLGDLSPFASEGNSMKHQWIKLVAKEPEDLDKDVLVYTISGEFRVACRVEDNWMTPGLVLLRAGSVTHWQPLELPEAAPPAPVLEPLRLRNEE
jgi:hypothetical protein